MGVNLPVFTKITAPGTRTKWEADAEAAIDLAISEALSFGANVSTNMSRHLVTANASALTTAVMTSVALPLVKGKVVTNLTFTSATTAANTPTNWWFALYSPAGALLRQTADQTSTAWGANTVMTKALATTYTVPTTGIYYAAIMVKATTPPTLAGSALHNAVLSGAMVTGMKVLSQTSGSALTATAPATIDTPTAIAAVPFVIAN
jgi:hypothetical protein